MRLESSYRINHQSYIGRRRFSVDTKSLSFQQFQQQLRAVRCQEDMVEALGRLRDPQIISTVEDPEGQPHAGWFEW